LRESVYTSLRLGLYEPVRDILQGDNPELSAWKKFLAGAITGAIGSTAGNPFDVLKTRMMASENVGKVGLGETASKIMEG